MIHFKGIAEEIGFFKVDDMSLQNSRIGKLAI